MNQHTDEDHQEFEKSWWGTCVNTFGEESKQISYAHRMGLVCSNTYTGQWPAYDLAGKSVVDFGCGPVSMLLKTFNGGELVGVDPCDYPEWVDARYLAHGVEVFRQTGESVEWDEKTFDEAWIYNCLQHVEDPAKIISNMRKCARLIRLFEWVDMPPTIGHPHMLNATVLDRWLGGRGTVENINENGAVGRCYYAVVETGR